MTPWQKIMRAANRGTSLLLSNDEVWALAQDDAIETRACIDDEVDSERRGYEVRHGVRLSESTTTRESRDPPRSSSR